MVDGFDVATGILAIAIIVVLLAYLEKKSKALGIILFVLWVLVLISSIILASWQLLLAWILVLILALLSKHD